MNQSTVRLYAIALMLVLLVASGCSAPKTLAPEEIEPIQSLMVMPVEIMVEGSNDRTAEESGQLKEGQAVLNSLLAEYFQEKKAVTIIMENQRESHGDEFDRSRIPSSLALGRSLEIDAVLVVTLQQYKEREGTEYSIIAPASVTFDYKLVLVQTGQILCSGVFHETQKPVLDNVFEFFQRAKRGLKWVTAETLLREGLQQKIETCRYLSQLP